VIARAIVALALAGCSWSFGSATPPCPPNGWLAGTDVAASVAATVTAVVAGYPCVGDVEQRDSIRALHCGVAIASAAAGTLYYYSARAGLRDRRRCRGASDGEEKATGTDRTSDR
jgi:hypothetical protein